MKIFYAVFVIVYMCVFGLIFYSVIRWLGVFIADRKDLQRRKRYASICGICMLIIVISMIASFVINFRRNTM